MTITHNEDYSCCHITFTDDEWDFIDSLPKEQRKMILRGMATPKQFGYKELD